MWKTSAPMSSPAKVFRAVIDWNTLLLRKRKKGDLYHHVTKTLQERLTLMKGPFEKRLILDTPIQTLPLEPDSYDLIQSPLILHWSENLSEHLKIIYQSLAPGGVFLGALFGEKTLQELKATPQYVEEKTFGAVTPRFLPLPIAEDVVSHMKKPFSMPIVDREVITKPYPSFSHVLQDLKAMGETNALKGRHKGLLTPRFLEKVGTLYEEKFNNSVTFEVLYMTGIKNG